MARVSHRLLGAVLCVAVVLVADCRGQQNLRPGSRCTNPDRERGTCIGIRECPALLVLLQQARPIPADDLQYLRESQCGQQGRNPLVCCTSRAQTVVATQRPSVQGGQAAPDVSRHRNLRLINSDLCGRGDSERIFGGNKTGLFEYPWMTLLAFKTGATEGFKCGGSIINENYILTAAHCIVDTPKLKLVSVRVGDHDTSTDRDCEEQVDGTEVCADPPQDIPVADAFRHPQYSETKLNNDIALIRLARPIRMNRNSVQPICLPVGPTEQDKQHETRDNKAKLIVAGWGATEKGLSSSPDLLKVYVPFVPTATCAATYKTLRKDIDHRQMCAGGSANAQDSCNGDSGGPLMGFGSVQGDPSPRYVQYGVVSFGHRVCGTTNVPGVYSRVGWYMKWILDNIS